ncbi:MAG: serine/threonine-protein phosphatase [Acidobacteriaceae bacterium]|nr:serine/threonine-protein phosphatase [Acidobacteriaceae bacterium]
MVSAYGISDPGSVRANNEDYYLMIPEKGLYLVADGMGGAQAGEHASRLAAETVAECIRGRDHNDAASLCDAFEEANRRVLKAASSDASLDGMGTTLLAALEDGHEILISSVGDSRAYVFENGQLMAITEDQTWVNEVGRRLGIDETSLKNHPMKHVLTMAIGVSPQLRVHSYAQAPHPGTQILLCSDGLHGVVEPETIATTLGADATLEQKCQRLVDAAKANGAPDNVTAVLLECK